jgi:uncharacterized protein (TIGR02265 family)
VDTSVGTVELDAARRALLVDERLSQIPAGHMVRGFLFRQTEDAISRAGSGARKLWEHIAKPKSRWAFRMYSVAEYIEEAVAAAAIIDPADPARGIRKMWREAPRYAPLLNAERFVALLGLTPIDAMKWLEQQRSTFSNFGSWRVEVLGADHFVVHYFEEWVWIESAHRGGLEGLLDACRVSGTTEVVLDSPFDGHIHVHWRTSK